MSMDTAPMVSVFVVFQKNRKVEDKKQQKCGKGLKDGNHNQPY